MANEVLSDELQFFWRIQIYRAGTGEEVDVREWARVPALVEAAEELQDYLNTDINNGQESTVDPPLKYWKFHDGSDEKDFLEGMDDGRDLRHTGGYFANWRAWHWSDQMTQEDAAGWGRWAAAYALELPRGWAEAGDPTRKVQADGQDYTVRATSLGVVQLTTAEVAAGGSHGWGYATNPPPGYPGHKSRPLPLDVEERQPSDEPVHDCVTA